MNQSLVHVCLFASDLLCKKGESLFRIPFKEWRGLLRKLREVEGEFKFVQYNTRNTVDKSQEVLEVSIKFNCKGLMVSRDFKANYKIAKHSHNWLKLKKRSPGQSWQHFGPQGCKSQLHQTWGKEEDGGGHQ